VSRQRGFVMLAVTVAIVLIAAIALMLSTESAIEAELTGRGTEALQAEYLAQAALQHASWHHDNNACMGDSTIPTAALGPHSYSATLDSAATTTTSYTFGPDRDAWIKEQAPDDNFGSEVELPVKNKVADSHRAVYHFDVASIPVGTQVTSATLWFYVTANDDQGAVEIHPLATAWTESTATWNTIGTRFDATVMGSIPSQTNSAVWVPIGATALAQQWVNNAAANHGIMLIATSTDLESKYSSREHSGGLQPYLDVTTSVGSVSPIQITAIGTLANGVSRTVTRVDAAAYQTPAAIVFQPGVALEDAYTWDGAHDDKNFGASSILSVNNAGAEHTTLLRFDLPPDVRVTSAVLGLYLEGGTGLSDGVLDMHRLSRAWVEGDRDDAVPGLNGGVTYDDYDGSSPWTTAGGDYHPTPVDTVTIPALTPGWYEWQVNDAIQAWLAGEPNNGFLLRASGGSANKIEFTSGDSPATSQHPRLTLTLACECGIACTPPQGSGALLMVVSSAANPLPADVFKRSLFESWGYTVTLLNDNSGTSAFDDGFAAHDVVYVSETSSSSSLGNKMQDAPIGVVSDEGLLNDQLGLSAGVGWTVGDSITVTDNSHYISEIFNTGLLQIYAASMEGVRVGGSLAPDLDPLGNWAGIAGLAALEADSLGSSGAVPARRVLLPFGRSVQSSFDWRYVNNNGRLIAQRAILWASGAVGSCDSGFRDEFAVQSYSQNDGALSWATDWLEINEGDGAALGDERIQGNTLRVRDNDGGGEGVEREADLSGAVSAILSFTYRRNGLDSASDYVTIDVSSNGAAGPWTELDRFEGPATDSANVLIDYDVSPYISANTRIRFLTSASLGDTDELFFENVEICIDN